MSVSHPTRAPGLTCGDELFTTPQRLQLPLSGFGGLLQVLRTELQHEVEGLPLRVAGSC